MKKEKEAAAIGCVIGLCALVSPACNSVKSLLSMLHMMCNGRGGKRECEGAG